MGCVPAKLATIVKMGSALGSKPDAAREAVADWQAGLDSAKRLVERTRFLLAGGEAQDGDALIERTVQATREPSSDTVQKPAGE